MTDPRTTPAAFTGARPARPVWLMPVIVTVVTGVIGMALVAGQGLLWMIAVIAVVDAIGVFTIVRSSRVNARNQQARAREIENRL